MKRDGAPLRALDCARLSWREGSAPYAEDFGDIYHSRDDACAESQYLFLTGNGLPERWLDYPGRHFCVGETGFGTGLNFLLTWRAWAELPRPRPRLHYLSIERHPLAAADLARALAERPLLSALSRELLAQYPPPLPGLHRLRFDRGNVTLDLHWGDAGDVLTALAQSQPDSVDAWFLDGFAPARNAAMWSPSLLEAVASLSGPGATFATFTAAGDVRRSLEAAGFEVQKVAGYGRKRHALRGVLPPSSRHLPPQAPGGITPWDLPAEASRSPDSALVLGGGLAGCTTAAALAQRGIAVTLLDAGRVAGGASGNSQGVLYTRVSHRHSALVDFALHSYLFAARFYAGMFRDGTLREGSDGQLCGSFQPLPDSDRAKLAPALQELEDIAMEVDSTTAGTLLGVPQPAAGLWFQRSGWLRPGSVCASLLARENIRVMEDCGAVQLTRGDGGWLAVNGGGRTLASAPCAVVAAGSGTSRIAHCHWLPVRSVRGQTTDIPTSPALARLRAVLCHTGYIAPARDGTHSLGATFDIGDDEYRPRTADHAANLTELAEAVPDWHDYLASLDPDALSGRVSFRCASPDYLPAAGPVPDTAAFSRDYAALEDNAKQTIGRRGVYLPGLYLTAAHGSRGLTSTPLAAELLAGMICGEPLPLERTLRRALAPARFLIRDLARGKR